MEKIAYLISSYNNTQNLIKFTDQKIGALLVVCGIEASIYFENSKNFVLSCSNIGVWNWLMFIVGAVFVGLTVYVLYVGLIKVIRPRFAKHYSRDAYSIFYFEHIAVNDISVLRKSIDNISESIMIEEITGQIYEVSKIINNKNRNCAAIVKVLFASILLLSAYMLILKVLST